jgi:hypothetical protein
MRIAILGMFLFFGLMPFFFFLFFFFLKKKIRRVKRKNGQVGQV